MAEPASLLSPDLYHGKVADNIAERTLGSALTPTKQGQSDIADATSSSTNVPARRRGLTVIGFSMGPTTRWILVADPEHVRSVVIFYGTGPAISAAREQLPRSLC